MRDFAALLKEHDLKATIQRINILDTVHSSGHASIDSIYEKVSKKHPSISIATIYKNISQMLQYNIIREIPIVGQKTHYELKTKEHIHLICTKCGLVEDRHLDSFCDDKFSDVTMDDSFVFIRSQINLYGLCGDCQV